MRYITGRYLEFVLYGAELSLQLTYSIPFFYFGFLKPMEKCIGEYLLSWLVFVLAALSISMCTAGLVRITV